MKQSGSGVASNDPWRAWLQGDGARLFAAPGAAWLRNVPFALFVVCILAYGAALAWYAVTRFDLANLVRDGNWDDAFYYLQIAYHMAEGRFSTFDGITRTNGYHPLWLFLITPFYWLFDKVEALFAIKAFEIVLLAAGVALVAAAARVARLPWIVLFAALPALYAQQGMLLGSEAALVLFMLGLLMLAMCLFAHDPARWRWPLAALAFALPWARLEWVAVAVAATAALCLLEWSGRFSCTPADASNGSSTCSAKRADRWALASFLRLRAALPLAGAFAGVLVYFAYNGVVFGGAVPVSGAVKAEVWTPREWEKDGGYSLAKSLDAFAQSKPFDGELLTALEVCVYALLAWWLSRGARGREDALLLAFVAGVFSLAVGHLAKFAQCVLFMYPQKGLSLWDWYFVPAYLMEALVVPLRCCIGVYVIRRLVGPRLPRVADVLCLAAIAAAMVVLVAKVDFAKPFRFVDSARDDLGIEFQLRSYMGTAVVNRLLPEDTLVGSWDSGVVGYFSRPPLMNLDGLVNTYDYKEALATGDVHAHDYEEASQESAYHAFWRRHDVFHFVNVYGYESPAVWGEEGILFKGTRGLRRFGIPRLQFRLFRSDVQRPEWAASPADRAAWFRERIAPHLEFQADGIGLFVEGRAVQAFAWDCTVDENEVAEWSFGGSVGAVRGWTQTADGLCSSDVLLPLGHLPPLRVRRAAFGAAVAGLGGGRPAIPADSTQPSGFDIYLRDDVLYYAKAACTRDDVETLFFLHLVPIGDDFDEGRESDGFNNLDFRFERYGVRFGSGRQRDCLATVPLPRYGIAEIRTGQYTVDGRVWQGRIRPDQPTAT